MVEKPRIGVEGELVGSCLVAAPALRGNQFERSVIYIYEQTQTGIAGLIINHRSNYTTEDLAKSEGYNPVTFDPIYRGGPVNSSAVVMLHTTGWYSSNTMQVTGDTAVSSDDVMIHKYLQGNTPDRYKFCAGAAVWAPQQLVGEFVRGSWLKAQLSVDELFRYNGLTQWDMALERAVSSAVDHYF